MFGKKIRLGLAVMAALLCTSGSLAKASEVENSGAAEEPGEVIMISDVEGLMAMERDPEGNYALACDVDAAGADWFPFAFHGSLEGNGYSILNLTVKNAGESIRETYDGNMKVYDTYFSGLFDELSGGCVSNLNLVNLRIGVETDQPCFIGGIAGYMEDASIQNCSVQGNLTLYAHDRMFGVGGIIGYGCGEISDTSCDVTLVCVDTDATTKDEQFMGGVCAAGYPDVHGCEIMIQGFDSDHGYVHDGGLIGMYMFYPKGKTYRGSITDNYVRGKIRFFEDNKNRRAYCNGFIGEIMNWDFENGRNKNDFVRDEVFTYDVDLLPHACDNPVMREEVTESGCEFGYVTYVCETCGYEERDHFTLKDHDYEWSVTREATQEAEGEEQGICKNCGAIAVRPILKVTPEPTAEPKAEEGEDSWEQLMEDVDDEVISAMYSKTPEAPKVSQGTLWILGAFVAMAALCITFMISQGALSGKEGGEKDA